MIKRKRVENRGWDEEWYEPEAGVIICYSQGLWLDILQQCKNCLRTPLNLYITPAAVGKMNSEVYGNF